jgi:hypothetical protein
MHFAWRIIKAKMQYMRRSERGTVLRYTYISHLDPFPIERNYNVGVGVLLQTRGAIEMHV